VSEPGHGTTFKVYLPRIDERSQPASKTDSVDTFEGNETILVVEDESSLRALTCNVLRTLGYRVLNAGNGSEALEIAATSPDVQLLLTDVVMPGVNGQALALKLTEKYRDLKVIYMSGYTGQGIGNRGDECPTGLFLAKPFTREGLARKVRTALDNKAPVVSL
jgi:CheY-like chemotaxis protein